ncbi:sigma-70 family RNA polymerase sigma factor [Tuwongella immobilis]|uniref:RNA polymerase sigma-70 region 2 domain-containing protein n=1 Tax=Tuwongella immobilis TaxID=692036 RepID=A0A6C2YL91_9BACT|nr:sigma-70 family RNA polymerase sigma factor [Tuwongella immobilis]VIP02144.1 rna polymerase sigma70 : RNA polymerase sigma factor, sigma-70 family OS=Singulisphaera acidiphila (strain ATCC BAA-1392 / DSM 18658 / VKM B-2454 / MOB10) GN=Sinac_0515 PE=4 SV=1: Sigma70_r2: Sigma70_r4 [Tuwongella immobilis]VTS00519.1 rna polymerase sigma70 : RNA polymerase sigma factor, sigma-70 family OS=Singulisphaera acidiphila (strain ATCC BAA-1392 / DSM 18658 / VKM B-2454 / MOB10) GN=Sinac_0515 PE=4 SV=1: Sigma
MTSNAKERRRFTRVGGYTKLPFDFITEEEQRLLVEEHVPFALRVVRHAAKKIGHRTNQNHFDELVSEAHLALILAAKRFDPARGVLFSTYASIWIRSFIRRYLVTLPKDTGYGATLLPSDDCRDDFTAQIPDKAAPKSWGEEEWRKVLRVLPDKQKLVVEMLFRSGLNLEQAGAKLGISRERVRQLKEKALDRIFHRADIPEAP